MAKGDDFLFSVLPVDNQELPLMGRTEEINKIKAALLRNQNVSVVGETKIGKTSILKTIHKEIGPDERFDCFIPVYLDLYRFSYDLETEALLKRILKETYLLNDQVREACQGFSNSKRDEFSDVVEYCSQTGLTLIILFDNFDSIVVLNNLNEGFFTFLRGNAIEKGLSIITASRNKLETLCHRGRIPGSQFWNVFSPIISLSLFEDVQHAKALLARGIESEDMQDLLISLVGVHPAFLKLAGNVVLENKLTDAHGGKCIEKFIYEALQPHYGNSVKLLHQDESHIINGVHHDLNYISILNAVGSGDINEEVMNRKEFNSLKQLGYIQDDVEGRPRIFSPLFARFLREQTGKPIKPYQGDLPYAFISYARVDQALVTEELQKLMDGGYRFWFDEGILPGVDWHPELVKALGNSGLVLLFVTQNSASSQYVLKEIHYAINKRIPVMPVYLEAATISQELLFELGTVQQIQKFNNLQYQKQLYDRLDKLFK